MNFKNKGVIMIYCFYHGADFDGKCSGAIVKKFVGNVQLIPYDYDQKFPWYLIDRKDTVYMCDVSLPIKDMNKLNKLCNLIYIDHHISKLKDLNLKDFKGIQNDQEAACILTWKYFTKEEIPKAVDYIGKYDIWDQTDPNTLIFQYGLKYFNTDPRNDNSVWNKILETLRNNNNIVLSIGRIIKEYVEKQNEEFIKNNGFICKFQNFDVLAVNKINGSSLLFEKHPQFKEVDILMVFGYSKPKWKFSLYTTKDNIDVSEICKKYGGGGHKKAAGFNICEGEIPTELYDALFR